MRRTSNLSSQFHHPEPHRDHQLRQLLHPLPRWEQNDGGEKNGVQFFFSFGRIQFILLQTTLSIFAGIHSHLVCQSNPMCWKENPFLPIFWARLWKPNGSFRSLSSPSSAGSSPRQSNQRRSHEHLRKRISLVSKLSLLHWCCCWWLDNFFSASDHSFWHIFLAQFEASNAIILHRDITPWVLLQHCQLEHSILPIYFQFLTNIFSQAILLKALVLKLTKVSNYITGHFIWQKFFLGKSL